MQQMVLMTVSIGTQEGDAGRQAEYQRMKGIARSQAGTDQTTAVYGVFLQRPTAMCNVFEQSLTPVWSVQRPTSMCSMFIQRPTSMCNVFVQRNIAMCSGFVQWDTLRLYPIVNECLY